MRQAFTHRLNNRDHQGRRRPRIPLSANVTPEIANAIRERGVREGKSLAHILSDAIEAYMRGYSQ